MKKIVLLGVLCFTVILILTITIYNKTFKIYEERIETFKMNSGNLFYSMAYADFFTVKFYYPSNQQEFKDFIFGNEIYIQFLSDPFSRNNEPLKYIPVYELGGKKPYRFMLISAGIDGKINNEIPDSVFSEDIKELSFYNEPTVYNEMMVRKFDLPFNLFDYFLGEKDLLVAYFDGIEVYKNGTLKKEFSPEEIISWSKKGFSMDCRVKGIAKFIDNSMVELSDYYGNKVMCELFYPTAKDVLNKDTLIVLGQLRQQILDNESVVLLNNCIVVDTARKTLLN